VRRVSLLVSGLIVALLLLGAVGHALAHGPVKPELVQFAPVMPPSPGPTAELPRGPVLPWPILLVSLVVVAIGLARPRRALAGALVLCFAVFFVETGIHSVHHVTDSRSASTCAVLSVSQHLTATDIEVPDLGMPPVALHEIVSVRAEQVPVQRSLGSHQGRAPPLDPLA
jgi:hypothetical protein